MFSHFWTEKTRYLFGVQMQWWWWWILFFDSVDWVIFLFVIFVHVLFGKVVLLFAIKQSYSFAEDRIDFSFFFSTNKTKKMRWFDGEPLRRNQPCPHCVWKSEICKNCNAQLSIYFWTFYMVFFYLVILFFFVYSNWNNVTKPLSTLCIERLKT